MLANAPITPVLPSTDLERSKKFYTEKLGLTVKSEHHGGVSFSAGGGTELFVYERPPSIAEHTLAAFRVDDLEAVVDELTTKGVVFEKYDFPGLKTDEKGIAVMDSDNEKAAWFKDPDGNILSIGQGM